MESENIFFMTKNKKNVTRTETQCIDGRYKIISLIGSGGMGLVYKAEQLALKRIVAVKMMDDSRFGTDEDKKNAGKRFEKEAQLLARLKHPAIPEIHDFFSRNEKYVQIYSDGRTVSNDKTEYFLVMDYIPGKTLEEIMKERKNKPFSQEEILNSLIEIAGILEYLHFQSPPIIYRDMKPSNVMTSDRGKIYLLDFGIARIFQPLAKGTLMGTPGYAPPEQYSGHTNERSDVYSLGMLMRYLLTGIDPIGCEAGMFIQKEIRNNNPNISEELESLVAFMTEMDPSKRPKNGREVKERLEEIRKLSSQGGADGVSRPLMGGGKSAKAGGKDSLKSNDLILKAMSNGDKKEVERLIALGADPEARNEIGNTPLHIAAGKGFTEIAEMLISEGADLSAPGESGHTPLHLAVINGQIKILEMLLSRGADVNAKNFDGKTPLFLEVEGKRRIKVIGILISCGADLNSRDNDGDTILHRELSKGRTRIAEILMSKGADVNARDGLGETLLHKAASHGYLEMAELLVSNGADVNARDFQGITPLQNAMKYNHKEILALFTPS